jgi:hypothetical protein
VPESDVGHSAHAQPFPVEQHLAVSHEKASHSNAIGVPANDCLLDLWKTPCRVGILDWKKTNDVGDLLGVYPVRPDVEYVSGDQIFQTNLSHSARFAEGWRGAIHYTVEPQAAAVHGGSLWICYSPGTSSPTLTQARTLNGLTVNLAKKNSTTLKIPWAHIKDYLATYQSTGTFRVYILNLLRGPSTSSSEIDVNVEIAAGPDFHFVIPKAGPTDLTYPLQKGDEDRNTIQDLINIEEITPPPTAEVVYSIIDNHLYTGDHIKNISSKDFVLVFSNGTKSSQAEEYEVTSNIGSNNKNLVKEEDFHITVGSHTISAGETSTISIKNSGVQAIAIGAWSTYPLKEGTDFQIIKADSEDGHDTVDTPDYSDLKMVP